MCAGAQFDCLHINKLIESKTREENQTSGLSINLLMPFVGLCPYLYSNLIDHISLL